MDSPYKRQSSGTSVLDIPESTEQAGVNDGYCDYVGNS